MKLRRDLKGAQHPDVFREEIIEGEREPASGTPGTCEEVHHLSLGMRSRVGPAGPAYPDLLSGEPG